MPRHKPYPHQDRIFKLTKDIPRYALFWEMGTGKSKTCIDLASRAYANGEIDTIVIVAPNGVERNWVNDEIPEHMDADLLGSTERLYYQPKKANAAYYKEILSDLLAHKGLAVLAMAYSHVMTKNGMKWLWKFLEKRKVFYILDEAMAIKNPNSKRTKRILASAKYAPWRRSLTGTPITNEPFDAYSIMKFLDLGFWRKFDLDSYPMFKTYFGEFEKKWYGGEDPVEKCVAYRNLDRLKEFIQTASDRVLKDDVLDLPPKSYSKRYFEITTEQRRAYDELKDEYMTWMNEEVVTAQLAITRLIRFRQIVCGYLPSDDPENPPHKFEKNPRMDLFKSMVEEVPHQAIVWANFRPDIDQIVDLLGDACVRYDGKVKSDDERELAKKRFQAGDVKWFVANPAAAGTGLTLHNARTVIYYSSDYELAKRLQSEDRAHRIGQEHPVQYWDIVAQDTVDEPIIKALTRKKDIADIILGDKVREWL